MAKTEIQTQKGEQAVAYWAAVDREGTIQYSCSADDANDGEFARDLCNQHINGRLNAGEPLLHLKPLYADTKPAGRDVTSILLKVVPGSDGMGHEVYAKSVEDVEKVLSDMGQELDDWQLGIRRLNPTIHQNADAFTAAVDAATTEMSGVTPMVIKRTSDQTVELVFASTRQASVFHRAVSGGREPRQIGGLPQMHDDQQAMENAPKDGTEILAWCDHNADPYYNIVNGKHVLTTYGAHAESLSNAGTGWRIVCWGGGWDEGEDGSLPDFWFVADDEFETVANPVVWVPLPVSHPAPVEKDNDE